MAHLISRIRVTTAPDGTFSKEIRFQGVLQGLFIRKGDLSTPDVTITALGPLSTNDVSTVLFDAAGVAADGVYRLSSQVQDVDGTDLTDVYAPPIVMGRLLIEVAGAGDTKSGDIYLMADR